MTWDFIDLENYLLNWGTSYVWFMAQFKRDQKMICLSPFIAMQARLEFISGLLFFTSTALWIGIWIGKTFVRESEHGVSIKIQSQDLLNLRAKNLPQIIFCKFHSAFPSYSNTALCFQEITCQSNASSHLLKKSFWRWRCSLSPSATITFTDLFSSNRLDQ